MKTEIEKLKDICMIKNVDMEMAIDELSRISIRCSNSVETDIQNVIRNLQRSIDFNINTLRHG